MTVNWKKLKVHNPDGRDFEFEGRKLAEKTASEIGTVEIFQTKGGKWVASQNHNVARPNPTFLRAGVFETSEELMEWLGHTKSAKALAEEIGLSASIWFD